MILVQIADNQRGVISYIKSHKMGKSAGEYGSTSAKRLINALKECEGQGERTRMSAKCQGTIDGKGTERIVERLFLYCGKKERKK